MSAQSVVKSIFRDAFESNLAKSQEMPAWLRTLRLRAFTHFEESGFPTTDLEDWKYTNISRRVKGEFVMPALTNEQEAGIAADALAPETANSRVVFVNGRFDPASSSLSELPSGVFAGSLEEALQSDEFGDLLREHFARNVNARHDGFTALNAALFSEGVFVYIPSGAVVDTPISLDFVTTSEASQRLISFPRIFILGGENSRATIVESYSGPDDVDYSVDAVVEVLLNDGARLDHFRIQREGLASMHIGSTGVVLNRNSQWHSTAINFGAAISRHEILVRHFAEGSECTVDGLYMVSDEQHSDTHSLISHNVPHCTSRQLYKGVLDDKSRAVFNGKVFVHEGAHHTDAMQTNRNLLLSNSARVDTKPQLEIYNEDVKCAHGATVGQLEEEEVFYLESRGLKPETARNLLTYGFAEEVIAKISVDSIRDSLDRSVLNRLHAEL